ncbi:UNVERIFIED_CONTAM: hypothetical protein ABIC26_000582 [Paenibacillus sp. PvR008]
MKIPIVWSGIMTVTGYFAYAVIQSVLLKAMFGSLPVSELQEGSLKGYLLQTVSAVVGLFISFILYRKGIGFAANFKKLKYYFIPHIHLYRAVLQRGMVKYDVFCTGIGMIETMTFKLANQIKRTVPDHLASIPVLKYVLALIINASMIIVLPLLASFFTGRTAEAVTILVALPCCDLYSFYSHILYLFT